MIGHKNKISLKFRIHLPYNSFSHESQTSPEPTRVAAHALYEGKERVG